MKVASKELCNELYGLSGWASTHLEYNVDTDELHIGAINAVHSNAYCPAYDLGYLLRKLPDAGFLYEAWKDSKGWHLKLVSGNKFTEVFADTPEDAACRLAIELFKQGVLK